MSSQHQFPLPWQQQAEQFLLAGDYTQAAHLYEQAITADPDIKSYYWQLGLIFLLQGEEAEAQTIWLLAIAEGETEEIEQWSAELIQVLETEAQRRETLADYSLGWVIRQHIRELDPTNIHNLLNLLKLSLQLETYTGEEFNELGILDLLLTHPPVNTEFLLTLLQDILNVAPLHPSSLEFAKICIAYLDNPDIYLQILLNAASHIRYGLDEAKIAARFVELCLQIDPTNLTVLYQLITFYQDSGQHERGIELAKQYYSQVQTDSWQRIKATQFILRGLLAAGGRWHEASSLLEKHKIELVSLDKTAIFQEGHSLLDLILSSFFLPYFADKPQENRQLQNQISQLCQTYIQQTFPEKFAQYRFQPRFINKSPNKPLKIGYLSYCLASHSVGWLARWVIQYHNQTQFQVYAYLLGAKQEDPLQQWYIEQVSQAHKFQFNYLDVAEKIYQDEIDILVDLDSITLDASCAVMALKPAPVQVSWLGWDASGIPAVDYFLADPYVLPETAQSYYTETIWRLPQTYIAVDGFEVGIPTLRRDQLNIPSDAVVYFSAQRGFKYHPNTARVQMQILKEVPNSYFLIKTLGDDQAIQGMYADLATQEGVAVDRLRFLPEFPGEQIHRANLALADVVLDTYPYNGATTTLETLWMGIPIVTKVGEQFASRNSYTMLMNAGITEGIAWSDAEYLDWGIRLGREPVLRQKISWQLRQSRKTSPLWNGKQFTQELEKAYQQMWIKYLENH